MDVNTFSTPWPQSQRTIPHGVNATSLPLWRPDAFYLTIIKWRMPESSTLHRQLEKPDWPFVVCRHHFPLLDQALYVPLSFFFFFFPIVRNAIPITIFPLTSGPSAVGFLPLHSLLYAPNVAVVKEVPAWWETTVGWGGGAEERESADKINRQINTNNLCWQYEN